MRRRMAVIAALFVVTALGCGRDKKDCRLLATQIFKAHGAYLDLKQAARRGEAAKFAAARKELDVELAALKGLELRDTGSILSETNFGTRARYIEKAGGLEDGYAKVLEAVEKDPKLAQSPPPLAKPWSDDADEIEATVKAYSCPN